MLTSVQRLNNLESALVSAQKTISELASDTEISSSSYAIELQLYNLKNTTDSLSNQLNILIKILNRIEKEQS